MLKTRKAPSIKLNWNLISGGRESHATQLGNLIELNNLELVAGCHSERSEESLVAINRFFALLRMTLWAQRHKVLITNYKLLITCIRFHPLNPFNPRSKLRGNEEILRVAQDDTLAHKAQSTKS